MNIKDQDQPLFEESRKPRCRFDLFVRLYSELPSHFPKNQRVFTFRGDTFTNREEKMLTNLMNIVRKDYKRYYTMILCDNSYPMDSADRTILWIKNNRQLKNILYEKYPFAFVNMAWPEWIKKTVYDKDENPPG